MRFKSDQFRTGANKGAAVELMVCADLLSKGFDVYRSVSPNSACDVIAVASERVLRIEVKSSPTYTVRDGADITAWLQDGVVRYHGHIEMIPVAPPCPAPPVREEQMAQADDLPGWITKSAAAIALAVSTKTIEKYVQQGKLRQVMQAQYNRPARAMIDPKTLQALAPRIRQGFIEDSVPGHVIDSCPTCPTTSTIGSQNSR